MSLDWSPADLGRQREIVRAMAQRAEVGRRHLQTKRRVFVVGATRTLSSPLGLAGCFLVGFVVGIARRRTPPVGDGAETRTVQQKQHPLRLLIGAWLWLRRSHVQGVDTGERTIPREPPLTDSARPVAIPSSEYVH